MSTANKSNAALVGEGGFKPHLEYCIWFWGPSTGKTLINGSETSGGPPRQSLGAGALVLKLEPCYEEDGARLFTAVCGGRTRGNRHKLKEERCKLVLKWSQLPGKTVQAPSLEVFKTHSKKPIPDQAGEGATTDESKPQRDELIQSLITTQCVCGRSGNRVQDEILAPSVLKLPIDYSGVGIDLGSKMSPMRNFHPIASPAIPESSWCSLATPLADGVSFKDAQMKVILAHQNPQSTVLAVAQLPFKLRDAVLCQEEQGSGYLLRGGTVVRLSGMSPDYEGHLCDIVGCHPPHKCPRASWGFKMYTTHGITKVATSKSATARLTTSAPIAELINMT
ncbi:hypothetical protein QYF61_008638, partial [Mycteria americana]